MSTRRFAHLTAAVMAVLLTAAGAVAADGPNMVVPEKIKDMGKVAQGDVLSVDFAIVNEGDETLEINTEEGTATTYKKLGYTADSIRVLDQDRKQMIFKRKAQPNKAL